MEVDIYDCGTPKYQSAQDIYDGLQAMASGEEIGIISEMFSDVSWENQDYYYADHGAKLAEQWDIKTGWGEKMWLMDVAVFQMGDEDVNEWMYQILCNDELVKRIGWKKLFIDTVLRGSKSLYNKVAEAFTEELQKLDKFDFQSNRGALKAALESVGNSVLVNPYGALCSAVYGKLKGLRLDEEKQLIAESRAMLTAYDDFMYGLKSNQYLYNQQERLYRQKCAELQASYENAVKGLIASAQTQGVAFQLPEMSFLEAVKRG